MSMQYRSLAAVPVLVLGLMRPGAANADEMAPPPPYMLDGLNLVSVGVAYDPEVLKKLLPADVTPVADSTGGINIYFTEGGYGLGAYSAAYFWADIEGFDGSGGAKGRWMLQGVYGPRLVTDAFSKYYGLPVRLGGSRHEFTPGGRRAVGFVGDADFLDVKIATDHAKCQRVAGEVNYVSASAGDLVVNAIPYAGTWCPAEIESLDVSAPAGDPIGTLGTLTPLWAGEVLDGSASPTQPVPAGG
jgi:hypothetical protein